MPDVNLSYRDIAFMRSLYEKYERRLKRRTTESPADFDLRASEFVPLKEKLDAAYQVKPPQTFAPKKPVSAWVRPKPKP